MATASQRRDDRLRTLAPRVLAALTRHGGDFATAEDAVQEAVTAAAARWAEDGVPADPRTWLLEAASRRLLESMGRETPPARRGRPTRIASRLVEPLRPAVLAIDLDATDADDDLLMLLCLCAHPGLSEHVSVVLTLRAVAGLTTAEIAGRFLVSEGTMAQRIVRAKQAVRKSGVPFALPSAGERAARLTGVLRVLYLIFSEGYVSSQGALLATADLASEAIRLARAVRRRLPEDPEVAGLLALMLLTDARRDARVGPNGDLIPLADQDRTRWDRRAIAEGAALVAEAATRGTAGPYQLQAAIAAVHGEAPSAAHTDWRRILALYDALDAIVPQPMVALNRAIALAMVDGPAAGLALVATLDTDERLGGHYRIDAARAQFFEMAGDLEAARAHYLAAAGKTASIPERTYLAAKAAALGERLAGR